MNRKTIIGTGLPLVVFIGISAVAYVLTARLEAPDYQRFSFATALSATLLHLYAFVLYVQGLKYFKRELRIAYLQISAGIMLLGVAVSQLSVVNLFDLQFWLDSGAVLLPYLLAVIPLLLGIKRFASNLGIKSRYLSLPLICGAGVVLGVVVAALPHAPTSLPEKTLRAGIWLSVFSTFFFAAAAYGTRLIRQKAGASYSSSLRWLEIAFIMSTIGGTQYVLELLLAAGRGWYAEWSIVNISFNLSGWLYLGAGYAFSQIGAPVEARPVTAGPQRVTSADIIVYAESLATNTEAIDPIVDGLRRVTARTRDVHALTADDQAELLKTYLALENYLVEKDPLRKVTRDELRRNVEQKFGVSGSNPRGTFWAEV